MSIPFFLAIDHIMLKFIDSILNNFRSCFSRQASFNWFVVIIVGFMIRSDHLGVTSVIRDLSLHPRQYEKIINFFHSSAWSLHSLRLKWFQVVRRVAPLYTVNHAFVFVGDGMKHAKEARRMPGIKKLHQESENNSKGEYIFGHLFGAIGILMGSSQKLFCLPLFINLQDGVKTFQDWENTNEQTAEHQGTHVVQMIKQAAVASAQFGKSIVLLDRYFLTVPALIQWKKGNQDLSETMHIVTKVKSNAVAYEYPPARKKGRGRPRKKGKTIKLIELFNSRKPAFQTATVKMYGKEETVQFLCLDLLWGQGMYQELRFVLVQWGNKRSILVSTDLTLEATDIIELYGHRFKIESMFREMKQVINAFGYHFWSKSMPKLNRYSKKGDPLPAEQITNEQERTNILLTIKAIEGYVMCACTAMGMLQMIAVHYSGRVPGLFFRYLRTPSKSVVSEATVRVYLRTSIFIMFARNPRLTVTQIIRSKQEIPEIDADSWAS
ncbi:transposase [Lentibacillus sp. CBA3610]|nr:transposase [Lentibacillus sp. CBA3610]